MLLVSLVLSHSYIKLSPSKAKQNFSYLLTVGRYTVTLFRTMTEEVLSMPLFFKECTLRLCLILTSPITKFITPR